MNKKNIGFIILGVIGAVVLWFLYKAFLLHIYYYITWESFDYTKGLGEIEIYEERATGSREKFENASFVLPEGFSVDEKKAASAEPGSKIYSDSLGRVLMTYSKDDSLADRLKEVKRGISVEKILKKNHVSSMLDVMKYLDHHKKEDVTFLSSVEDIQTQYVMVMLAMIGLPNGENYYITGDYHGYLIQQKNIMLLYLLHDETVYEFSFVGTKTSKFSQADIVKFASTVTFEE